MHQAKQPKLNNMSSKSKKKNKQKAPTPKKEKIVYIDDGSTVVDMSATYNAKNSGKKEVKDAMGMPIGNTWKDKFNTYKQAVRQMIKPMFVMIGFICVIFAVIYLILTLAS